MILGRRSPHGRRVVRREAGLPALGVVVMAALASGITAACSAGDGIGHAEGSLNVPDCWSGRFVLEPDFFGGVPYRRSLQIRLQESGDYTTYSDGMDIQVRDLDAILGLPAQNKPPRLGEAVAVRIPSSVTPPGVPIAVDPDPALVDIALNLQRTCRLQNVALYAGTVALNADGACEGNDTEKRVCPTSSTETVPPPRTATSSITFKHLFNGIPEEPSAEKRLTEATFDIYLADPREVCPGGLGPPPRCRGHLTGAFRFTFERGRPAQRFP